MPTCLICVSRSEESCEYRFKLKLCKCENVWVDDFFSLPVVSLDEDKEVIGNLKVSLEAAKALTGIYQEFHQKSDNQEEGDTSDEREEEEDKQKMKEVMQLIDYDDDSDL